MIAVQLVLNGPDLGNADDEGDGDDEDGHGEDDHGPDRVQEVGDASGQTDSPAAVVLLHGEAGKGGGHFGSGNHVRLLFLPWEG